MPFKIYTYEDPYKLDKADFWSEISALPHFCSARTLVNGLKDVLGDSVLFTIFVIRYSSLNEKSPTRKGLTTKFRQRTSENLFSLSGDTIFLLFSFSL